MKEVNSPNEKLYKRNQISINIYFNISFKMFKEGEILMNGK